jgi:2-polyprenyl-6-methoxyphenol hydroxylase-like FAD-dependent oxidoreductase
MSKASFHVAIVGAGLGGLAAAIGIARAGHRVTVIEQAPALGEVGPTKPALENPLIILTGRIWHPSSS